ncbi:MAG: hypothetical protein J7497_04510, partial [Chitinophagaceae bacterium]|nr:hypothetical protein [Chitinophagaceae bacterium]
GVFSPDQPDLNENYHFGLVWEGKSLDACTGDLGEYMRYNNPHKFSLYLALGLPVIVWKDAAIAEFVKKHNIGFAISGFDDLENLISNISNEQYSEYVKNVEGVSDKIRKGYYLDKAISQLTKS